MNNFKQIFERYNAVVFLDTETTGLNSKTCQIIELAALRIEQTEPGTIHIADKADVFVRLPEGQHIPERIVQLTGITDEILESEGVTEAEAAAIFTDIISDDNGPVLLVAHHAQFDLLFISKMLQRHYIYATEMLETADYLDSKTVYKDRRRGPHHLANAIVAYKLQDKVHNTHRASDDVAALFEVVKAMDNERADLLTYVNIFGYDLKHGVQEERLDRVTYWPQKDHKYIQPPNNTLPARFRRARG